MSQLTAKSVAEAVEHFLSQEVTDDGTTNFPELCLQGVPYAVMDEMIHPTGCPARRT